MLLMFKKLLVNLDINLIKTGVSMFKKLCSSKNSLLKLFNIFLLTLAVSFSFFGIYATDDSCINVKLLTYEDCIIWVGCGCPDQFDPKNIHEGPEKEKNLINGLVYQEERAIEGNVVNQEILAGYYFTHKKDFRKGVYWSQQAVLHGCSRAMSFLRFAYFNGNGVIEDSAEGFKWAFLAAARGEEFDKNLIEKIKTINSKSIDLLEGKKRAQIWENEHPKAFLAPY